MMQRSPPESEHGSCPICVIVLIISEKSLATSMWANSHHQWTRRSFGFKLEITISLGLILGSVSSVIELFYSLNVDSGWEFSKGSKPSDATSRKPHQIIVDWNKFRATHFAPERGFSCGTTTENWWPRQKFLYYLD